MSTKLALRAQVTERLTAAAEEIFALFERTLAEYEVELSRSREQHHHWTEGHPWAHHRSEEQLWDHQRTEGQPWEPHRTEGTQTWTQRGAGVQVECVKEEPEEPFRAVCVKTEESSLLQLGQTEHRQEAQGEELSSEPHFSSASDGHTADTHNDDDWEPFRCSAAQMDAAALNSGVQVEYIKDEPEEDLRVVCVKTEEFSLLQHRQTEHRQDTQAEELSSEPHFSSAPEEHSPDTDNDEDWEPFSCSSAQAVNSGLFLDPQSAAETRAAVHDGNMSEITSAKKHQCPVCLKTFGSKGNVQRHAVVHTGEKPFSCSICNKRLNSKSYLIVHMRSHTGEKPYSCPFCSKAFSHKSAFNFHVQTHSTERPFSCSICDKSFTVENYLKVHMKTHSRERPYSCSVCGASFTQKSSLNIHMRTHSGDKPFSCSVCQKAFTFKHNLDMHARIHSGPCWHSVSNPAAVQSGTPQLYSALGTLHKQRQTEGP